MYKTHIIASKTCFVTLILSFAFVASCTKPEQGESSEDRAAHQKPNVVLILTDDQGWGDLSYNGNKNLSTPHIDAIARQGASFSNFYVSPVCSPTRAELLTGRYHLRGGVKSTSAGGERLDLDETTIAEVFKEAGYQTAIFGKWHNGMQYPYHPKARGFDEFYGFASGHWDDYFDPQLLEHNGKLVQGEGYITNDFTNKALKFIERQKDRDAPFFVYLPYNTPHSPMQVSDRWWNEFDDKKLDMKHHDSEKEDIPFTKAALAMVENIDWNVGKITEKLKTLGLEENTIVLFASDNGPNSWRWNAGMRGRKGSTDEGGTRSPLFIKWPETIEAGRQISEVAAAIDLLPTLAELAGIEAETNHPVDGRSLKPLLLGNQASWEDRLIFSHWDGRTSVRNSTYRLDHQGGLYNIRDDRGQQHDLSSQKPELTQELSRSIEEWEDEMLSEDMQQKRPFPVGHPDFKYTQLPARDGIPHGNIERSNRFPNATFFTNCTSKSDSITWDVEVLEEGTFHVTLYYTLSPEDIGTEHALIFNHDTLNTTISIAHDPPLTGMEHDRIERIESYAKDFRPQQMGRMQLEKGRGQLTLKANDIPGNQAADIRLIFLERLD